MKIVTLLAIFLTSMAVSADALAQRNGRRFGPGIGNGRLANQQITLNLYDAQYSGQSVIPLKQLINRQYPQMRLHSFDLVRVRLVAKSQNGGGSASLRVGQRDSSDQRVYGQPQDFYNSAPRTYDRLVFENPNFDSRGVWQINLRGNIKVNMIVVVVRPQNSGGVGPRPPRYFTTNLDCSSWDHNFSNCTAQAQIVDANVLVQHSRGQNSACIKNVSFGFYDRTLWVKDGCRATFSVTHLQ